MARGGISIRWGLTLRGAVAAWLRIERKVSKHFSKGIGRSSASMINAILKSLSDCAPIFSLSFSHRDTETGFTARHSAVSLALLPVAFLRNLNSSPVSGVRLFNRYSAIHA